MQEAVDTIIKKIVVLHCIVVNAGCINYKASLNFTQEEIEMLFNVNIYTSGDEEEKKSKRRAFSQ